MIFSSPINKQRREEVIDKILFSGYTKQELPKKIMCVFQTSGAFFH